jgi:hypothetical protein
VAERRNVDEESVMTLTVAEQVQWLVDRALISDLLYSFARSLDTRDFATYVGNYSEHGYIELPQPTGGTFVLKRAQMSEKVPASLSKYSATHHISSNHQIEINGDTALARSYLQAVHVGKTPSDHWDAGGWYDCTFERTSAGWKFQRVKLTAVWLSGDPSDFEVSMD